MLARVEGDALTSELSKSLIGLVRIYLIIIYSRRAVA
jgi:hypothetical protein